MSLRPLAVLLLAGATLVGCASGRNLEESTADGTESTAAADAPDPGDVLIEGPATSNVSIDASADGRTVAVGWYVYDEASGAERAVLATSTDAGRSFTAPVTVAQPAIQYPDVVVLDDGTILVGSITYDLSTLIDPDDQRSWPGWPVIYRSTDGGKSFEVMADLLGTIGSRVLTGTMPTSLAATGDGATIVFTYQDNTPPAFVPAGHPALVEGTSALPTWAVVSTDGGATFRGPQAVAPSTCSCCQSTAFTAAGRAGAAMRLLDPVDATSDERDPGISLADATGTFAAPVEIHDDGYLMALDGCPASGPGVAEAGGLLHAAWWTGAEGRRGWWYTRGTSPTSLDEPVSLLADDGITYSVHLAADTSGQAWVVGMHWADDQAGNHLILWHIDESGRATMLDGAPPVAVSAQAYDITDIGRDALVVWIDGDAVHVRTLTR